MTRTAPLTAAGWLATNDAAAYLGMSRRTVERAAAAGSLPFSRDPFTGRRRFHRTDLDAWVRDGSTRRRGR